jgi:hypothetical protein
MSRWVVAGVVAVLLLFGGSLAVIDWLDRDAPRTRVRAAVPEAVEPVPPPSPATDLPPLRLPAAPPAAPPVQAPAVAAVEPVVEEDAPEAAPATATVADVASSLAVLQQRIRSRCGTIQFAEGSEPVGYLLDIQPMEGQVRIANATVTTASTGVTPSQQICIRRALLYQVLPAPGATPGRTFQARFVLEGAP